MAASSDAVGQPKVNSLTERAAKPPFSSSLLSPSEDLHNLNSIASLFIKRSLSNGGSPDHHLYMKPSQFFSRYFNCRFPLLRKTADGQVVGIGDDHSFPEIAEVVTSNGSAGGSPTGNWRHSKRQLSKLGSGGKRKRRPVSCPTDCDGVTRWPETSAGSVARLNCLELLKTIEEEEGGGHHQHGGHHHQDSSSHFFTPASTTAAAAGEEEGSGGEDQMGSFAAPDGGLLKLDVGGGGEVLQAEGYRLSGKC